MVNGHDYSLDPAHGKGEAPHGSPSPPPATPKATYRMQGRTTDNTSVEATVSCAMVIDFGQ